MGEVFGDEGRVMERGMIWRRDGVWGLCSACLLCLLALAGARWPLNAPETQPEERVLYTSLTTAL